MGSLRLQGWSLIPGPHQIAHPPSNSIDLHDIASYDPGEIADCLLGYPGCRLLHPAEPTWWEWRAEWRVADRFIDLAMTLFDERGSSWGGSPIDVHCDAEDLMALWASLRERFPAVWLHNEDCEIHTPHSFRRLFGA